ncbi:hypothetical protein OIU78_020597 [Salix suchowensis]|nr:hypothetical protein OIU78_020597 [Salix suchowensis]
MDKTKLSFLWHIRIDHGNNFGRIFLFRWSECMPMLLYIDPIYIPVHTRLLSAKRYMRNKHRLILREESVNSFLSPASNPMIQSLTGGGNTTFQVFLKNSRACEAPLLHRWQQLYNKGFVPKSVIVLAITLSIICGNRSFNDSDKF